MINVTPPPPPPPVGGTPTNPTIPTDPANPTNPLSNLTAFVQAHPVESAAVALLFGVVLAKGLR